MSDKVIKFLEEIFQVYLLDLEVTWFLKKDIKKALIIKNAIDKLDCIFKKFCSLKTTCGVSLVAQRLRICLLMQGTRVWALVWEDPTSRGATKPMHHNYWACTLEPTSHNYWSPCASSPCFSTREATAMRSPHTATKSSLRSPQLEKAHVQ